MQGARVDEVMSDRAPLCLLACADSVDVAEAVAHQLGGAVTPSRDVWFACGEAKHVVDANVRGMDVYVFQRPIVPGSDRSIYDRTMMLLHAVDAARCADADRITVVVPYLPCGRQDKRKGHVREGVSTGLFARMLAAAGVDMVMTVEPHNEALFGCYAPATTVFEPLTVAHGFAAFLAETGVPCDVVASTDLGGLELARRFARDLESSLAALSKERDYTRSSTVIRSSIIGDVRGRSVLIVDDIVDTAGSVQSAVTSLWEAGATDVSVAAAHMLLSGDGWARLHALAEAAAARGVAFRAIGTSSVLHSDAPPWYSSYPLEPVLANAVREVNRRGSLRALEDA